MSEQVWYKNWFNSPYYHVLYKNRDLNEAALFIDKLIHYFPISPGHFIWDLACGKGRHSIHLNLKGMNVTGTDLSENSIREAMLSEGPALEFYVHDMRRPFRTNYFDFVLNLFTSIGYFENPEDNEKVFLNVYNALRKGGYFVVDYFNCSKIMNCNWSSETKTIDGIQFCISKKTENGKIIKRIEFNDQEKKYFFEEKVSLLSLMDFKRMSERAGFRLTDIFGDYQLATFDEKSSDRLILIFRK